MIEVYLNFPGNAAEAAAFYAKAFSAATLGGRDYGITGFLYAQ